MKNHEVVTRTEYIEREAAINSIMQKERHDFPTDYFPDDEYAFNDGLVVAANALDEVRAADVAPVRHGRWSVQEIYKHEMSYGTTAYEPVYKCSACGNLMESYLRYDEPIMQEDADFPRYCPNCGALMDKDGDGDV